MSNYPTFTFGQSEFSTETLLDDLQIDRATNGAPKGRAFYDAPKKAFSVNHQLVNAAEKAAMEAFYSANRLLTFSLLWDADGVTYTCIFASAPVYKPTGTSWTVTCNVVQA